MTDKADKAKAGPQTDREPTPDQVVLRYTGKGMGAWLHNIPARDLTAADIEDVITRGVCTKRELLTSGCYEEA